MCGLFYGKNEMGKKKEDTLRQRIIHQIVMNLGYETAGTRTLRSCGIDHRDLNSILVRSGVIPRGTEIPYGKYSTDMTINQFLNQVEREQQENM